MKRIPILLFLFALLISACAPQQGDVPANDSGPSLKVTDGTTEKTYTAEQLMELGADKAVFRDVTYIGVPLSVLLADAGFDPTALKAVKATATDGFSVNYEPALFNKADTLVAYTRDGAPLAEDEFPFRMVLPAEEGKLNPRQLVEIRAIP